MREKLCSSNAAERSQQEYQGMGKKHPHIQDSSEQPTCGPVCSHNSHHHRVTSFSEFTPAALLLVTEVTFYSTWKQNFVAGLRDKPCSKIA